MPEIPVPILKAAAQEYINKKIWWSQVNDLVMFWAPRASLMSFPSPFMAGEYLLKNPNYKYKNDPGQGALDHLIHHGRLQKQLQDGVIAVPWQAFDCDKVASWFYATVRNHSLVKKARLITIVCSVDVTDLLNPKNWGHHTICGIELKDGTFALFDTNGYHLLPNLNNTTICQHWSKIYGSANYHYVTHVDLNYPW